MKKLFGISAILILFYACGPTGRSIHRVNDTTNLLNGVAPFTSDSMVNAVIEIPAGTNQKWEVDKITGQIEWEAVTPDSSRVVDYLPYPANYGYVPRTLLPEALGGDGDPVDIFVLAPFIARGTVVKVRLIGIIHMLDDNETDSKLLAVSLDHPGFDVNDYESLQQKYPGVADILKTWLLHYKGPGRISNLSVGDEKEAMRFLIPATQHTF